MRTRSRALLVVYGRLAREERERQTLTQAVVADRAGLSVRHLREIEHGRVDPSFFTLVDLAQLGLGRDFLMLMRAAEEEVDAARPARGDVPARGARAVA